MMQPQESGALFGHAQRDAQRTGSTVIIRVPLVLEASYELYSDACGYSQRYNERVSMCQYKHTRFRHECIWFLNAVFGCFCHLSLCRFAAGTHRREDLSCARLKASTPKVHLQLKAYREQ